jgi:hypothetical protein
LLDAPACSAKLGILGTSSSEKNLAGSKGKLRELPASTDRTGRSAQLMAVQANRIEDKVPQRKFIKAPDQALKQPDRR